MASWKKVIVSGSAAELSSLSLDTALTVPNGGTGASTLTSGGILYGNGTGAIQATSVLSNGQLLIGDGSGVPTLATLTAGEGIDITNGAGSITITGEDASTTNKGIVELATTAETTTGTSTTLAVTPDGLKDGYQGSTNVTTLGTIGTGTWQGTAIADAYVADNLTIDGGTVDNTVIGGSTPAAGTFTSGSFKGIAVTNNGTISGAGSNIVLTGANSSLTGSFSGSFTGDGSGLTGVTANFPTTLKNSPLAATDLFFYNDNNGANPSKKLTLGTLATDIAGDGLTVVDSKNLHVDSGSLVAYYSSSTFAAVSGDITITAGGTAAIGSGVIVNDDVNASAGIVYTKLNFGGSGHVSSSAFSSPSQGTVRATINGVQTDVDTGLQTGDNPSFAGVTAGNIQVGITGDNEIDTTSGNLTLDSAGGTTVIDDALSVTGIATFQTDIIVRGTASFENTQNLEVADRFILLASGSTSAGDGGIVIQQAADKLGAVFAYDGASTGRWGIDTSFSATASAYTPAAFMGAVVDIDAGQSDIAAYQKNGNIKVDSGDIFIYS